METSLLLHRPRLSGRAGAWISDGVERFVVEPTAFSGAMEDLDPRIAYLRENEK